MNNEMEFNEVETIKVTVYENPDCNCPIFKVESNNELDISPKLEVIDERKRALKEEYDKKLASLEVEKDEIIDDSQNNIVKTLVKKKEN